MAKKVMTRAWAIAKEAVKNFGGKASQYIAEALRMAWKEVKTVKKAVADRIEELEAMGFNRWTKGNMDRLYINSDKLGFVCDFYKSGHICSASLDGEKISNNRAFGYYKAKTYIEFLRCSFHGESPLFAVSREEKK